MNLWSVVVKVRPGRWLYCMPATDILPAHHRRLTCEWGTLWNVVRLDPNKKYLGWQSVGNCYCHSCQPLVPNLLLVVSLCLLDRICQAPDVPFLQLLILPLEWDHSTLTTDPGTMTTVEWPVPQKKKKQSKQKPVRCCERITCAAAGRSVNQMSL